MKGCKIHPSEQISFWSETHKIDFDQTPLCGYGAVHVRVRFYPHVRVGLLFVGWVQNMKIKNKNSDIFLKLTEQLNKTVKWMKIYLNKSSFNFVRLIFRSRQSSRSRRFWGSWLQSVRRLSALSAVIAALLFATIHPIRLNARSQLAEEDKMEKTNTATLTWNHGNVSRASRSFQKHRGSPS